MNDNNKMVMKFLNFLDSYELSEIEKIKKRLFLVLL